MLRRIGVLASLAVVAAMLAGVSSAQAQVLVPDVAPTGNAGVCIFTGLSGALAAGTAGHGGLAPGDGHGIQNIVPDLGDVTPDVERGSYSFTTLGGAPAVATCAGVFNHDVYGPTPVDITSNGFYDNIYCGTGFAHDLDGLGTTVVDKLGLGLTIGPPGPDQAGYEIPFVAGTGPLLIGPDGREALSGLTESLPSDPNGVPAGIHGLHDAGDGEGTGADGLIPAGPGLGLHGDLESDYVGVGAVEIEPASATTDNCVTPAGTPAGNDGDTDGFTVQGFFVGAEL